MSSNKIKNTIGIIGGGFIGITTALALQLLGYQTIIYTDRRADTSRENQELDPKFASLYASGSVISHSTKIRDEANILATSIECFSLLARSSLAGLRFQKHFELSEFFIEPPDYLKKLQNVCFLPEDGEVHEFVPKRSKCNKIHGWYFDCLFSESTPYLSAIFSIYEKLGGTIILASFTKGMLPPHEVIINCTGLGTRDLFDDYSKTELVKGILLLIKTLTLPLSKQDGHFFSYNYRAGAELYANSDGTPADVYSYPRTDALVIGGTRDKGDIDSKTGEWIGEETLSEKCLINGVEVPRPIIDINRDILFKTTGIDILDSKMNAIYGYRFCREDGVRLESEEISGRVVIHNYAHGGAGLTLSWGCAAKVVSIINKLNLFSPETPKFNQYPSSFEVLTRNLSNLLSKEVYKRFSWGEIKDQ